MRSILLVAKREFLATVATRAFIIGLLIVPAMGALGALVLPRLFNVKNMQAKGDILLIDSTDRVLPELQKALDPKRITARRKATTERALTKTPQELQQAAIGSADEGIENVLGPIPNFRIIPRPADANIEQEKKWLYVQSKESPHLALVVMHRDAVVTTDGSLSYGSFDLFVPPKLDDRIDREIQQGLREAIINARMHARSLDKATIDAVTRVPSVRSVTVTPEKQSCLSELWAGADRLLTTMVEEKSSRVIEVLLSAVSPIELMAGKLLGQMGASLLGMCIYLAMGIAMLSFFALLGMLNYSLIFYLLLFFIITYLVMGSLMMAIGAAVNDMKEAQGLLAPLTIIFIIPWMLWVPISSDPNSTLSMVMSFLPPVNTFAMLLRMTSSTPPPFWQVWLSIAIGIGSVVCALWFAAKVLRIGLLMFGKPPNFATLIRWVRAA